MRAFLAAVLSGLFATAVAGPAQAQGIATSFDQLHLLVRPGETLIVRDVNGAEIRGRLGTLTPSTLVLLGAQPREFTPDQVSQVKANRGDPLRNGALIGFGIGAGLMGLGLAAACGTSDSDCAGPVLLAIPFYGGLGAAIGVGFDAMVSRPQVIYQREMRGATLGLGPLINQRAPAAPAGGFTGAVVTVGF